MYIDTLFHYIHFAYNLIMILEPRFEKEVRHDRLEARKVPLDAADHRGGLRRARLARAPDDGAQGALGLERAIPGVGVPYGVPYF